MSLVKSIKNKAKGIGSGVKNAPGDARAATKRKLRAIARKAASQVPGYGEMELDANLKPKTNRAGGALRGVLNQGD